MEDTVMYVRAFATNIQGITYSDVITYERPLVYIGQELEGGIVFYVDETGEHGLVAAMEDLGQFQWGCYGTSISGADGQFIGTGYQNTLDIVAGCSDTNTAAYNALNSTVGGYEDWYLPSKDELYEMYSTIGNGGPDGYIGGPTSGAYWSSSESSDYNAWVVNFNLGSGATYGYSKGGTIYLFTKSSSLNSI
jgi:hypothetical protein